MQRVLIIGPGGAGKSTLAVRMAALLALPVIHLDREYWRAGWVEPPRAEWQRRVDELVQREHWIMDGNYSGTLERRVQAADTVLFLDFPRRITMPRVVWRWWKHRGGTRADMAPGCNEQVTPEFLLWLWRYPSRSRKKLLPILQQARSTKRVEVLTSRAAVENFLATFAPRVTSGVSR